MKIWTQSQIDALMSADNYDQSGHIISGRVGRLVETSPDRTEATIEDLEGAAI